MHGADVRKRDRGKKWRSGKVEQALSLEPLIPLIPQFARGQMRLGREGSLNSDCC